VPWNNHYVKDFVIVSEQENHTVIFHILLRGPAMFLYFALLVSSGVCRYQGQSSLVEPKIAPPKNFDITDTSTTDVQDQKKRKIAEAILLLIDDEIKIQNLLIDTNSVILTDEDLDIMEGENVNNEFKYADEVLVQQLVNLLLPKNVLNWSNILRETNFARKQRKALKKLYRYRADQVSRERPRVEKVDTDGELLLLKNEVKANVLDTLIPIEKSDVENGINDDRSELQSEDEYSEREEIFYFDTNLPPSPFRGLFLSRFNSGFADFENNFYFTAAPYRPPSSPVHLLDCSSSSTSSSSTSSSSCDNKLCTVQCGDGNKIVLHCASNSVEVVQRQATQEGKFSYEVTCGNNNNQRVTILG